MATADRDVELRAWMDHLAIQTLIFRYSDAVTRCDWDQCLGVFSPGAVWESPALGLRFDSPISFVDMLRGSSSEVLVQTPHAPVISMDGSDRAQASTTIHELTRGLAPVENTLRAEGSQINFEQYGIYFDDIARMDGDWKFTHRVFVPIYVSSDSVTGEVLTPRTGLIRPIAKPS